MLTALIMLVPSYLGQLWLLVVVLLFGIPSVLTAYSQITIDTQYKQIISQYSVLWQIVSTKTEKTNDFRAIRIQRVLKSQINYGGMGSTHNYETYNTYLDYDEGQELEIYKGLSKWEFSASHQLAEELGLEVHIKE